MLIKDKIFETIEVESLKAEEKHEGIGLIIDNCRNCDFFIDKIEDFNIGLLIRSSSKSGAVNNRFFIKGLINNKHNLDMVQSDTGWVNQNTFIGGHLAHYSNNPHDSEEFSQIRLIQRQGSKYGALDNNLFLNMNIEGAVAKYFIDCTGSHNIFDNMRYERGYGVKDHRVRFNGTRNTIRGGFDADKLEIFGDYPVLESMSIKDKLRVIARSIGS